MEVLEHILEDIGTLKMRDEVLLANEVVKKDSHLQ